jgi:urea transporter
MTGKVFGRDPATLLGEINAGILALIVLFVDNNELGAAIGAVTTAITALIVAFAVKHDGQLAAIVGVGRTIVALAVLLGVEWDAAYQILLITALETVAGIFVRDRVDAPVPASETARQRAA